MARFAVGLSLPSTSPLLSHLPSCLQRRTQRIARRRNLLRIRAKLLNKLLGTLLLLLAIAGTALSQNTPGVQDFSTNKFGVDLATGAVNITIPIRSKNGAIPFNYVLQGNSSITTQPTPGVSGQTSIVMNSFFGVTAIAEGSNALYSSAASGSLVGAVSGAVTDVIQGAPCNGDPEIQQYYGVVDSTGATHVYQDAPLQKSELGSCYVLPTTATTLDSMYTTNFSTGVVTDNSGRIVGSTTPYASPSIEDADGNKITFSGSTNSFTDTLGATALTLAGGSAGSPYYLEYADASGNTQKYTVAYTSYTAWTAFGCTSPALNDIQNQNSTELQVYLPTTITTPTFATYTFSYESQKTGTGTYGSYTTGRIAKIVNPSGGYTKYSYSGGSNNRGLNCTSLAVPTLTVEVNDNNGNDGTWTFTNNNTTAQVEGLPSGNYTVTEQDAASPSNKTVYTFAGEYQAQAVYYQGTSTVLKTVVTCYNGEAFASCPSAVSYALPITEKDVYTQLGSSGYNEVQTMFDTYGNVTSVYNYDYGASTATLQTGISYGTWNGSSCVAIGSNIYDKVCHVWKGTPGGTGYYEVNIANSATGHPTQISQWTSSSTPWLVTNNTYNSKGTLATTKDPAGNQTTLHYDGSCNSLVTTSTTYPVSALGSDSQTWDCNGGVVTSRTDVNGQVTSTGYAWGGADPLYRPKIINRPDGGATSFTYNTGSSLPWTGSTTVKENSTQSPTSTATLDGLGRVISSQSTDPNASGGKRYTATTYNNLGQVASVTNPYFCNGTNCSPADATYGSTSYTYDALGRITQTTNPDTTRSTLAYTNRATVATDASGVQKAYQSDGLGRLQYVCDGVGTTGTLPNGHSASSCGLDVSSSGFLATYGYDPVGRLTSVNYSGQTRSFSYDGLGRMLTSTNPESGSITNVYDTGTAGDLYTKTFPKPNASSGTVAATYTFDGMHRPTYISFSDGSAVYQYAYDSSSVWGTTVYNTKGRMALANHGPIASGGGGASIFSYDVVGNITNTYQCTPLNCGTGAFDTSYTYDYLGNVTGMTDAAGITYTKNLNSIGQLTSITSSKTGIGFPGTVYSSVSYNPFGEVSSATYGDGIVRVNTYDKMGRPTVIQDGSGSNLPFKVALSYTGNGSVHTYQDYFSGANDRAWTKTYDTFGRIATASDNVSGLAYSYSYDEYGNRWKQQRTAGTGFEVDLNFNGNNRITTSGYVYDSAGNLTGDGSGCGTCWGYDDVGNLISNQGDTYLYDALGHRTEWVPYVGSTQQEDYAFGDVRDTWIGASSTGASWTKVDGGVFTYNFNWTLNSAAFNRADNLGTPKVTTDYTGAVKRTEGAMGPFGDNLTYTGGSRIDLLGLAGGDYDQPNNSYSPYTTHFGARNYSSQQGRWLSPDPAGLAAVDLTNPQSWNQYAYVMNNPVSFNDPSGRWPEWLKNLFGGNSNSAQCKPDDPYCVDVVVPAPPDDISKAATDDLNRFIYGIRSARHYFYAKVEGGFGFGIKFKIGPGKLEAQIKRTWETKNISEADTKSEVKEAGVKVEFGGAKAGLSAGTTQVEMLNDQIVDQPATQDFTLGYEGGSFQGSNSEVGIGGSFCVVLCGGVEVGVRGDQVMNTIGNTVSNYVTSGMGSSGFAPTGGDLQNQNW